MRPRRPLLASRAVAAARKKKRWWLLGLAAALTAGSLADAEGFRRYGRLAAERDALEAQNAALRLENQRLRGEVRALHEDPEALERAAREELGFVRPGEVVVNLE